MSSTLQTVSTHPIFIFCSAVVLIILIVIVGFFIVRHMVNKVNAIFNTKNIIFNTPNPLAYTDPKNTLLAKPSKFPVLSKTNSNTYYSINTWLKIDSATNHTTLKHIFTVAGNNNPCASDNDCYTFETIEDQRPTVWLDGPSNALYFVFNNLRSGNVLGSISAFRNKEGPTQDGHAYINITILTDEINNPANKPPNVSFSTLEPYPTQSYIMHWPPPSQPNLYNGYLNPLLYGLHKFITDSTHFIMLSQLLESSGTNNYFGTYMTYLTQIFGDGEIDYTNIYQIDNISFQEVLIYLIQVYNHFYIHDGHVVTFNAPKSNRFNTFNAVQEKISKVVQENKSSIQKNTHILGFSMLLYISTQLYNMNNSSVMNNSTVTGQNNNLNMNLLASYDSNSPHTRLDLVDLFNSPSSDNSISNVNKLQELLSITGMCTIKVENIPLYKWFMLTIIAYEHSAEIYINSKLVRSIVLPMNFSLSNNSNLKNRYLYVGMQDLTQSKGSIKASITNFSYYNRLLNPDMIQTAYKVGPKKGFVTKLKTKLDNLKNFFLFSSIDTSTYTMRGTSLSNWLEKHLNIKSDDSSSDYDTKQIKYNDS